LNVSKQISDYNLISDFPGFAWNWEGISQNKKLISNATFIEKAFLGELTYSNNLLWNEILSQTSFDVSFWNKNLETFFKATESEKQIHFWSLLTQKQNADFEFIFENKHFPWDWSFITENSSEEAILDSYEEDELFDMNIFRYKFDEEFTKQLYQFSKIQQYDHRKDFKEAWNIWIEENDELVNKEAKRVIELGYKGNVFDKMFKSARYYFRKKSTEKKEPKKRRVYIGIQSELLTAMDKHISFNKKNEDYKPSNGFDDFCKNNVELLKIEVSNLCKNGIKDPEEIKT